MDEKEKQRRDSLKHIQACDQAGALMVNIALVMSSYFKALIENGLTREEALMLTNSYQNIFLSNSLNQKFIPPNDDFKNEEY
jgi:hypothetical protein